MWDGKFSYSCTENVKRGVPTWLALPVDHVTLDLWDVSSSPMLDIEVTKRKKKKKVKGEKKKE